MVCGGESLARLQVETFDLVINPEAAKGSAALATMAKGEEKKGFGLSPTGFVFPFNQQAKEIFHMGLFDDIKQKNQKTYEELICQLSELSYQRIPPALCLTDDEMVYAKKFRAEKGMRKSGPVVGINTGGGSRWPLKRWTLEGFVQLATRLSGEMDGEILLLGGPAEAEINREIMKQPGVDAVDTGCLNPPRSFAALVNLCDVLVTGDTLTLHIGLALHKRMVVLFGPTSTTEIDLYDQGTKIAADMDCLCCYRQHCDQSPNCMESIPVESVYGAVKEQIRLVDESPNEDICNNSNI
jgi:heptosyltransferase-2